MPAELIEMAVHARGDRRNYKPGFGYLFGGSEDIYIPQGEPGNPDELAKLHLSLRENFADLIAEFGAPQVDRGDLWLGNFLAKFGILPVIRKGGADHAKNSQKQMVETCTAPLNDSRDPVFIQTYSRQDVDPHESPLIVVKVPEISYSRGYLHLYPEHGELWANRETRLKGEVDYKWIYRSATVTDYHQFGELTSEVRANIPAQTAA